MKKNSSLNPAIFNATIVLLVLFLCNCKKEEFGASQVELAKLGAMEEGVKLAATGITSTSYYLVNSLPSGYVKDGSKDYTTYVQAAVNKYSNIVFPSFPIMVSDIGISIGSNKTITFQDGGQIRLKASSKTGYKIFSIYNASNITLYNPVIIGDRDYHIGTSGEWGSGIGIYGSSNITIYNARITNCWGDGIYLGQVSSVTNCKNILIKDSYLRNNRRAGISIIGVDGLKLENLYSGYNKGTVPATGINFEPNNSASELKNIRIDNPKTEYNGERGIQITGHNMLGNSNKYSDITIVNHLDTGSPYSAFKLSLSNKSGTSGKMYGLINIINPSWYKTANNRPLHVLTDQLNYKIAISSPEVTTSGGTLLSWTDTYNLLMKAGSNVSVTKEIDPAFSESSSSVEPASGLVFAVNAGGSSFLASNGITYSADKSYSGGSVYKTGNGISNTSDDVLYQSERFGNFSYNIPLVNGSYEITFRMAEVYHKSSGKRQFDVVGEGNTIISNLDIFSVAGLNAAYNIVKTISVEDGILNLSFRTDIDNAKVSAFHIVKK